MRNRTMALVLLVMLGCAKTPTTPASAGEVPQAAMNGPRITFPDGFVVRVELATNDETRAQGLMYRDTLPAGTGMLFLFARDDEYPFWMKNTLIPLDMIWVTSDRQIAAISHSVPPCKADPCPSYPPHAISRYVLEVAGGEARKHGLKAGDQLRFEGIDVAVAR
jgi:uncharacterized membrane protein (UPF0127 family)